MVCQQAQAPVIQMTTGGMDLSVLRRRAQKEKVVVVMGSTGTGKSRLSIDLATQFQAEIINSDKIQVYEGLDIVTNKITEEECNGVPHHLLGIVDPDSDFTARNFVSTASMAMKSIVGRGKLPIIAGGSNSFIEALVDDENYDFRSRYCSKLMYHNYVYNPLCITVLPYGPHRISTYDFNRCKQISNFNLHYHLITHKLYYYTTQRVNSSL